MFQSSFEPEEQFTPNTRNKRIIQIIVDILCILIVLVTFGLVYFLLDPNEVGFFCNDTNIFNPYYPDTIPYWAVALFGILGPLIFIVFSELVSFKLLFCAKKKGNAFKDSVSKRKWFVFSIIHGVSLFILGCGISLLLTEIGKRWVGRLRPHFISVCDPNLAQLNCTVNNHIYNYISTSGNFCRGDASKIKEARLSFPSGHASFSCYTMLFLIIYLEARLHLLRLRFIKPLIQMTAFIAAYVTCISRISDNYHHPGDVLGGVILGCAVAIFITTVVGRVLWVLGHRKRYYDFDLKPYE
jgi:phosphatidate phosphatase